MTLGVLQLQKHQGDNNISHSIRVPNFERKDVWNMKWADDNPNLLAVMEKGRMYILRGTEPEEPVACTAYLCSFHDLQVLLLRQLPFPDASFIYIKILSLMIYAHLNDLSHQPAADFSLNAFGTRFGPLVHSVL
jgi:hypothetical protein